MLGSVKCPLIQTPRPPEWWLYLMQCRWSRADNAIGVIAKDRQAFKSSPIAWCTDIYTVSELLAVLK